MKGENLLGEKFGKLKVIEKTDKRENAYIVWKCICDCGGMIDVNTKKLKRGTVTNCGCIVKNNAKNGTKAENLLGKKFGYLTVKERVENQRGRTCWKCRCDCGKSHIVTAHELKSGKCKSCGCYKKEHASRTIVDLKGKSFGRLKVLYEMRERDENGSVMWMCACSCGKTKAISESGLVHGQAKSCGCYAEEHRKNIYKQLHRMDGTCIEILEKRKNRRDNTSGFRGIVITEHNRYKAYIGFKKEKYYLGTFDTFIEAKAARLNAEEKLHNGFVEVYYWWKQKSESNKEWAENNPLTYEVIQLQDRSFHVITNEEYNAYKNI